MPLTLVLGPANSAKAGEVFGAYAAAAPRGALLVVPTAVDAEHYSRELAERGSVLGSVVTFAALVGEIARRVGYRARRLTALQRDRVLARAIASVRFDSIGRAAEARGFTRAAGELISELERSLVGPDRLAGAMHKWGAEDPRRAAYARDVAAVYMSYARELERLERVDSELFAWRAIDALRQAPARWGNDPVFLYGFDDLHPLERDAIETLARIVGVDVTVSLTYEPGRSALEARAELVEELRPIAERVIETPAVDEYYAPSSRAVLHQLERSLFEPADLEARIDPGPAVALLESAGTRAEAELVASEVIALLKRGTPPGEIAIVYRSLRQVGPVIARTFAQYGIPVAIEERVAFGHTALGRGLLALARCALVADQASAVDLLRYLRTPGLLDRPEVADALELAVRREALLSAAHARERLGFSLQEIDSLRGARDPAAELARHGRRLLAAPHRMAAAVLEDDEELDARALAAMLRALAELDELGDAVRGHELIELLEELEVGARPGNSPGAVVVSEPLAIRARRFRAVFVCGLEEDEFPRRAGADPFLGDERRRELAAASGLRLRLGEDSLGRERYLFYAAISRATERIVLSYRSADEEGNLELPSPFIADVAELLVPDWRDRRRQRLLNDLVWPPDEAPTARELARSRAAELAPAGGEPPGGARLALTATALAHVRHTRVVSAGALEAFADCPVKWLVERELQPKVLEGDPDPLLRGSYMHDTLERVLARLGSAVTPESLPDALQIMEDEISELSPRLAPGRAEPLRRAVAEAIAADLRRYLEWEAANGSGWKPRWLELRFGFEGDDASVPALELGDDGVAVRGAIDRVDVGPDGRRAVVRDYKSGSARQEHQGGRWRVDRQLQVALYMLAARQLLGLDPVAGLYQPLGGGDLRARGVFLNGTPPGEGSVATDGRDPDELNAELDDARERAVALAARLRAGELVPCPATCSREGCRYPSICRIS